MAKSNKAPFLLFLANLRATREAVSWIDTVATNETGWIGTSCTVHLVRGKGVGMFAIATYAKNE